MPHSTLDMVVTDRNRLSPPPADEQTPLLSTSVKRNSLALSRTSTHDGGIDETSNLLPADPENKTHHGIITTAKPPPQSPSPSPSPSPPPPSSSLFMGGVSTPRFYVIFLGIMFSYFVVIFDSTLLASSHPVITSYFGAARSASWLSTAYLLTSTAFQPLFGRVSDSVGRKPVYVGSLVVFTLATLGCAVAPDIVTLIVARAVAGMGAGGIMGMGSICIGDLVPIERRGPFQGCNSVIFGFASMAGAALGGLMADSLGWRWEFGCQVPLLCLCLLFIVMALPSNLGLYGRTREPLRETLRSFDLKGSLLLTFSTTLLILGLDLGGNLLPWSHPVIVGSLVAVAVMFPMFLHAESVAERPVMPLELIHKTPVSNLIFANHIAAFLINGILFNVPIFFQAVLLTTATESGLRIALPAIVSSVAGIATGFLVSYTRSLKWAPLAGSFLLLAGVAALSAMRAGLPDAYYLACLVPSALGQGLQFPGTFLAVLAATEQRAVAVVTTTLQLWRSLGAVAGIAGTSLVLQAALARLLDRNVRGEDKEAVVRVARESIGRIRDLPEPYRGQVVRSYEGALSLVFASCAALAMVSLLLIVPIKLPRLGVKAETEERRERRESREERREVDE